MPAWADTVMRLQGKFTRTEEEEAKGKVTTHTSDTPQPCPSSVLTSGLEGLLLTWPEVKSTTLLQVFD